MSFDDDILKAEGSVDKLVGRIHERFGDAKEAIMKKLSDTNTTDAGHR